MSSSAAAAPAPAACGYRPSSAGVPCGGRRGRGTARPIDQRERGETPAVLSDCCHNGAISLRGDDEVRAAVLRIRRLVVTRIERELLAVAHRAQPIGRECRAITRYARAASARRSPSARLYSAVPRSSQCPSMVIVQVAYRLSTTAFSSSTDRAGGPISSLSSSKNTGLGRVAVQVVERRRRNASSRTGSGGTMVGSFTGSGGAGTRVPEAGVTGGGGGICRATGGCFLPQPAATIATRPRMSTALGTAVRIIMHSIAGKPGYLDQSG